MKLAHWLSQPAIVRTQLIIAICGAYASGPIARNSLELYERAQKKMEQMGKSYVYQLEGPPRDTQRSFELFLSSVKGNIIFSHYKTFSTIVIALMVCIKIAPVDWLTKNLELDYPLICYLPWRFLLYGKIPEGFVLALGIMHLHWRLEKVYIKGSYRMDLASFLLHEQRDIERIYKIHGTEWLEEELTPMDNYLLKIVCYRFKSGRRTLYRVRPNRTREARAELNREVAFQSLISYPVLIGAASIITPFVVYSIFSDVFYLQDYPGCYPALEEKYKILGHSTWSIFFWGHRLFIAIFEGILNTIVWIDSGISATITVGLVYLMNCDLLMYWRHLDQRLGSLISQLRVKSWLESKVASRGYVGEGAKAAFLAKVMCCNSNYDQDSLEIVYLAADFFKQIRHADHYISSFLRTSVLVWLSHAAMLSYAKLVEKPAIIWGLRWIQMIAVVIIFIGMHALILNHRTMRLHKKICTLIALIDTKYKKNCIQLLGYYTGHSWATYTLFDRPYRPTALLSVVGWTYTCGIIVENLTIDVMASKNATQRLIIDHH